MRKLRPLKLDTLSEGLLGSLVRKGFRRLTAPKPTPVHVPKFNRRGQEPSPPLAKRPDMKFFGKQIKSEADTLRGYNQDVRDTGRYPDDEIDARMQRDIYKSDEVDPPRTPRSLTRNQLGTLASQARNTARFHHLVGGRVPALPSRYNRPHRPDLGNRFQSFGTRGSHPIRRPK